MNTHDIEYTDQKLLNRTLYISLGLFLGIETLVIWLVSNETWLALGILSGIVIPIVYFLIRKRNVKKYGQVHIGQDQLVFNVFGQEKNIAISDIEEYQIAHYNGVTLFLKRRNGENFALIANVNFCKSFKLEQACIDIQEAIQQHIADNPTQEVPVRAKSMYEKTWFIAGLSVITAVLLGGITYAMTIGVPFYPLLIPFGIFAGFWVAVFNARKLRKG